MKTFRDRETRSCRRKTCIPPLAAHFTLSSHKGLAMKIVASAVLAVSVFASSAHTSPAWAADTWLACQGTMSVMPQGAKAPTSTAASNRVLSYDDGIKRVY